MLGNTLWVTASLLGMSALVTTYPLADATLCLGEPVGEVLGTAGGGVDAVVEGVAGDAELVGDLPRGPCSSRSPVTRCQKPMVSPAETRRGA